MLLFRNPSSSRLSSHLSSHATASSSANARVSRSSSPASPQPPRETRAPPSVSPARRRRRAFFHLPNRFLELRTPLERERSRVHVTRRPVRGASVVRAREVRVVVVRAERVGQKPRVAAVVRRKRAAAVAGFRVLGSRQPRHLRARGSHQRLEVRGGSRGDPEDPDLSKRPERRGDHRERGRWSFVPSSNDRRFSRRPFVRLPPRAPARL